MEDVRIQTIHFDNVLIVFLPPILFAMQIFSLSSVHSHSDLRIVNRFFSDILSFKKIGTCARQSKSQMKRQENETILTLIMFPKKVSTFFIPTIKNYQGLKQFRISKVTLLLVRQMQNFRDSSALEKDNYTDYWVVKISQFGKISGQMHETKFLYCGSTDRQAAA